MIVVSKFWTNVFSFGKASAITIFPVIFLKDELLKRDQALILHESIHLRQAIELGIIFFYIWYLSEFIIHFMHCHNFDRAYLRISFEREAYSQQHDPSYLSTRKFWAFWKYV